MRKPDSLRPRRRRLRPEVALCYGTRPQVIKAACLLPALRRRWHVLAVDTGQHYDYALNAGLYDELGVAAPDVLLNVGTAHPVEQTARIAAACSQALIGRRPRVVVVIGDTNSTLGCAVAASQLGLPVVHVEAGLRSGVIEMAEERNRVTVDHVARLLCAPSAAAVDHLCREQVSGSIVRTGDVARDVLEAALELAPGRQAVTGLPPGPYVLATLHRAELTDDPRHLEDALRALGMLELPVALPLHPRTRRRMAESGLETAVPASVVLLPPFGYLATLTAVSHATLVVTDSGGVQREAYWLGVPCVTLRRETEWEETVSCGANRLVEPGSAQATLAAAAQRALAQPRGWARDAYGAGDAAEKVAGAIATLLAGAPARVRPLVAP